MTRRSLLILCLLSLSAPPALTALAGPTQAEAASKTAKFATVQKSAREFTDALEAKDLAAAKKLLGKEASFKGKVVRLFSPASNNLVILNFARDYKTALVAVVRKEHFALFPDLKSLEGKEVLVTGKIEDYRGQTQAAVTKLDQIRLVQ